MKVGGKSKVKSQKAKIFAGSARRMALGKNFRYFPIDGMGKDDLICCWNNCEEMNMGSRHINKDGIYYRKLYADFVQNGLSEPRKKRIYAVSFDGGIRC